ncbi:hypothetical protein HanXRQr2_Chr13g0594981 [Helianthus annuus]|uniref:Uncharacterized protein n=1 Tax=Helianthus annuus TaxID=4232 RepID=A0A9K3HD08_HELAN|nr:hypothetical protein HanXRQr2_Chr13g0594981 [Helianthus annuus]KAJ0849788.1 hypothetical protein HanPSC8_Chr13g0573011 [Helianthus annuus]
MKALKKSVRFQVTYDCHLPVVFPPLQNLSSTLVRQAFEQLSTSSFHFLPSHPLCHTTLCFELLPPLQSASPNASVPHQHSSTR